MTDTDLKNAEEAADRYDGLGAPMNAYQPHVAALRAKAGLQDRREVYGPDFNGVVRAVPERSSCEPVEVQGEPYMPTGE